MDLHLLFVVSPFTDIEQDVTTHQEKAIVLDLLGHYDLAMLELRCAIHMLLAQPFFFFSLSLCLLTQKKKPKIC